MNDILFIVHDDDSSFVSHFIEISFGFILIRIFCFVAFAKKKEEKYCSDTFVDHIVVYISFFFPPKFNALLFSVFDE